MGEWRQGRQKGHALHDTRKMGIQALLIILMLGVTTLIFSLQTGVSLLRNRAIMQAQVEQNLLASVEKEALVLEGRIEGVATSGASLSRLVEVLPTPEDETLLAYAESALRGNPLLFGMGVWFEPERYRRGETYHGPYLYREGEAVILTWDYSTPEYNYHQEAWYKAGFTASGGRVYTEPYFDSVMETVFMTCATPFMRGGAVAGITSADMDLNGVRASARAVSIGEGSHAFLVTAAGYAMGMEEDASLDFTVRLTESDSDDHRMLGTAITGKTGKSGVLVLPEAKRLAGHAPIGDTGLTLVLTYPQAAAMKELNGTLVLSVLFFLMAMLVFAVLLWFILARFVRRSGRDGCVDRCIRRDRRHHRRHPEHSRTDEPAGIERGNRSRTRRRAGERVCGCGR